ncbi:MAG: response regulator, partial [Candidatus Zixiibacteriota bacterium]
MSYRIKLDTAKILVVDDESEITEIVETFLTEAGYKVTVANSGSEAVKKAKQFKPDVILLDIMMPGTDGYAVCQQIKKEPEFANTPVIFLTGKDREEDMGRSFKSGGDMYI